MWLILHWHQTCSNPASAKIGLIWKGNTVSEAEVTWHQTERVSVSVALNEISIHLSSWHLDSSNRNLTQRKYDSFHFCRKFEGDLCSKCALSSTKFHQKSKCTQSQFSLLMICQSPTPIIFWSVGKASQWSGDYDDALFSSNPKPWVVF